MRINKEKKILADEFMKDFIQIPKILDQLKNATSGSVSAQTPIEPEDKNQLGLGL